MVLVLTYGAYVGMRLGYPKKFAAFRASIMGVGQLMGQGRREEVLTDRFNLLRNLTYFSLVPLSLLLALRASEGDRIHASDWKWYLFLLVLVGGVISLQRVLSLLFAWVLDRAELFVEHFYVRDHIGQWVMVPLLPLCVLGVFYDPLGPGIAWICVGAIAAFHVLGLVQSLSILEVRTPLGLGWVLLYLCASEILPWWMVVEAVQNHWGLARFDL